MLSNPIEYLKGVGPMRGELLRKELGIHHFGDLLLHFPFRYIDKSTLSRIRDITPQTENIQVVGTLSQISLQGEGRTKRLTATLRDSSGCLELVWFQGISWVEKTLKEGVQYFVYGRVSFFNQQPQIPHPEMERVIPGETEETNRWEPVYPSTEKLKSRSLTGRAFGKLTRTLLDLLHPGDLRENIPVSIIREFQLISRELALFWIHHPKNEEEIKQAQRRLKFEELFMSQIRILRLKTNRHQHSKGYVFGKVGDSFLNFFQHHLPFELTGAQKRVVREIRQDTQTGIQMNRLLQGDVGSGKTMVALLSMLLALDNGYQSTLMAPTEILARQHFQTISTLLKDLPLQVGLLTGNIKGKKRKQILEDIREGNLPILLGTHAVIEEEVVFKNLGLAIVDEQHRFGVAQRAKLWEKNTLPPHILVMTATPIPRTMAMTIYGDLDVSVIDELPPGRKAITTVHRPEFRRPQVMDFIKSQIQSGRQAYIVYPLIEESEKMDYENLMKGVEEVKSFFPEPQYLISMVHGRQPLDLKTTNMRRFVRGETQIMVATTVIEVGVDVPNASVMVVESAEKFGLSQLHQLRGRVGRGADQSYCILVTGQKLSREARERIRVMTHTSDGFVIAEKDMELRGPGDLEGLRQSGALDFKLADIIRDKSVLEAARSAAEKLLVADPDLVLPENSGLLYDLRSKGAKSVWGKIS
ncbi:MAG: ATP-dependent DNA helicase RecG [Chitinophagaceae bacterium]